MKGVSSIQKNGSIYWYARIDSKKVYCGKDEKGRKLAEAAKSKDIAKKYENREMTAGLKVKRSELKTIKDLANWYMTLPTIQEKKSYSRKINACTHLLKFFSKKPINQVEGDTQERYREYRKDQGAAEGTIDYEIEILAAMYHLAHKRKKIHADSLPGEFIQKNEVNPRRIITEDEYKKLLDHADPSFKDVLICGYESAMRSSEIAKLTAGQVYLNVKHISGGVMNYIDLGIFDTKTKARRTVPVSAELKEVLARRIKRLDKEDYVFTNSNGGKYINVDISSRMNAICRKAGLTYGDKALNKKGERIGIVFHCCRHTRTSKWVEMGFSDEIVRRATGHKSLEAYQRYVKLDPYVVMSLVEGKKRDKNGIKTAKSLVR